ncbi:autophagy-related 18a isoform X1 [Choristoneura fumiferana]|uniref:autophagy-related 18a isoform X1 n=1 Tax=Choristoneura fumiferana TaxID=7141 RepID=UPI003D15A857
MSLGGQNTDGSNAGGIFVQFNQDCTSLVAGSASGYHLFALTPDEGVEEIYASNSGQDTCLVDRLFSSSLVAIVTVAAPRKLIVCHYKKGTEICNYSYSNTILAVKLNRSRLVVCLEESLHIHNIRDMKILHTIRDTPPNPRGLCALAPAADRCLLAYPGSSAVGEVQIFDAVHLTAACVLSAHESGLAALAWSACGRRLATASERGTVIRVFAVPERARLFELRRGVKRCVTISCLAFSACGALLAAASNTETVHVFRLQDTAPAHAPAAQDKPAAGAVTAAGAGAGAGEAEGGGWLGWLSSAVAAGAGLLPAHVADVLAQGRAFAVARLPQPAMQPQVAFTNVGRAPRLLVATHDGLLLVFALDAAEGGGGDCALLRTHRLLEPRAPPAPHPHPHPHMPDAAAGNSYAGALRGRDPARMTESERAGELGAALEGSPPRGPFDLRDPRHFPPMPAQD